MQVKSLAGLWLAATLSATSLGAAGVGEKATSPSTVQPAALADAVQHRDKPAILALLKRHADVNGHQGDGATALHWAAYLEDADTTSLLIRAGANVNAPNNYGVTPLVLASENGNATIIQQ